MDLAVCLQGLRRAEVFATQVTLTLVESDVLNTLALNIIKCDLLMFTNPSPVISSDVS